MAWYNILFFSVLTIFLIKTILSWVFGDTDVDIDCDGDADCDVSTMFSFKGLLHFLLGFSTYLSAIARFNVNYSIFDTYHFTVLDYFNAGLIGVIFAFILWVLYKSMMKLNHSNDSNPDFNGCQCTVLTNLGNGSYVVLIKTALGILKETLNHIDNNPNIDIGSIHHVIRTENGYVIE